MKALTGIGARPQFVKTALISNELRRRGVTEILVHSGQHYDIGMSDVFFTELQIPAADINLGIGGGQHGWQTGNMLIRFEEAILEHTPDVVLVHGDTNSTIAAALAAAKLNVPVAHNEAGLRSLNRSMPEEHNRVLTDHCSDLLFCPTTNAVTNLAGEGIREGVHQVGDVMYDVSLHFRERAAEQSTVLKRNGLEPKSYVLATLHRPYTVDDPERLSALLDAVARSGRTFVLPIHPRTKANIEKHRLTVPDNIVILPPQGYLDFMLLTENAAMLLTDTEVCRKKPTTWVCPA